MTDNFYKMLARFSKISKFAKFDLKLEMFNLQNKLDATFENKKIE